MLVFALALAALVVAAAKPQKTVAVPVERASIMLATDVSGSMQATDVAPNRLIAAQRAAQALRRRSVPQRVNVGVMAFNQTPRVLQSPTPDRAAIERARSTARAQRRHRDRRGDRSGHCRVLRQRARRARQKRPPAAIVLLSDGASTSGRDPVAAAQRPRAGAHPRLHGRARHRPTARSRSSARRPAAGPDRRRVPPDPAVARGRSRRRRAARPSPPRTQRAQAPSTSGSAPSSAPRTCKRQVTAAFAGGGLVLLLVGAALSLRWFGRLII